MPNPSSQNPDFRLLFECAPGLYLILSPELKILAVSNAYLRATMTIRENILDKHLFEVFPDNPAEVNATGTTNLRASLNRVITNLIPDTMAVQKYDIRKPESEGGQFEVRYWSPVNSPVIGADGKLLYIIHRVEDVTEYIRTKALGTEMEIEIVRRGQELQEANKRLRVAKEMAEVANRELESFSYSIAHDLRAPIRAMVGFSSALLEDTALILNPDAEENINRVVVAAKKMGHLIDCLLNLSRLSRKELTRQPVNLETIAKQVISDLATAQPQRTVQAEIQKNLVTNGDADLLKIVLTNLLSNAWKFTEKRNGDQKIEFGVSEREGRPAFFVRDNGAGFDMQYANKLFGAFQRLHTEKEFAGTGIGLATVQRIIHRHGGKIWAEAEPDQGATFYFTLNDGEKNNERSN